MKDVQFLCAKEGCGQPTDRYPRIQMTAVGGLRGVDPAAQLVFPVPVCAAHQPDFPVQVFLSREIKMKLRVKMMEARRKMPDFDNAWVEWGTIHDDVWKTQVKLMQQ